MFLQFFDKTLLVGVFLGIILIKKTDEGLKVGTFLYSTVLGAEYGKKPDNDYKTPFNVNLMS